MDVRGKTIAVTGATGFVGRYLVRALLDRGARVIGVVRHPDRVPALARAGVDMRRADLANRDALRLAFAGADAVIANAGLVSLGARRAELIATNTNGTHNVMLAAAAAGIGRVVLMSSTTVYRPKRGHLYHEDDVLRTEGDPRRFWTRYPVSKACAEREAWKLARSTGIALTAARPAMVYGAFDSGTATFWLRRLASLPVSVWPALVRMPPVYAGDVGEAVCRMLETPASSGRAYNLCRPPLEDSLYDVLAAWRRAGGRAPLLTIPIPMPITRRFSIDRATRELRWSNRSLEQGFGETFALEAAEQSRG